MGYRTVVVFNNDQTSEWENDPELGRKIAQDMHKRDDGRSTPLNIIGGEVLECVHADTQTLAILDGYSGRVVVRTHWFRGQTQEGQELTLLKELAEKHGYRIAKKPAKKVA